MSQIRALQPVGWSELAYQLPHEPDSSTVPLLSGCDANLYILTGLSVDTLKSDYRLDRNLALMNIVVLR